MQSLVEFMSADIPEGLGAHDEKVNRNTEAKIAMTMAHTCLKDNFRFGPGYIMVFNGVVYEQMTDETMRGLITEALEYKSVGPVYVVNSIGTILKHLEIKLLKKQFRPRKSLIAFSNVVLDLESGDMYTPSSDLETSIVLPFEYDPEARCDRFKQFLGEVLPDVDTVETLQEFCGALFVDRTQFKIENILFLVGTGSNGKSVVTDTLKSLLGNGNYTTFEVKSLVKNSDYNLATMNGKLANICSDMGDDDISGGTYKALVSGEQTMARFPYGRPFAATELPLIIVNVNKMPVTTDHTFGNSRRPIPIPFMIRISEEKKDLELSSKLRHELPGIFNWVVEGRRKLISRRCKFNESKIILEEKERLRVESNSVLQFLNYKEYAPDNSEGATLEWVSTLDLYKRYQEFCREFGKKNIFESMNMGKIMTAEGYEVKRKSLGRGFFIYIGGAKWQESVETELEEMMKQTYEDLPF